ncbi:MAG: hypothetical protein HQL37_10090, partial [Alphaproteobacteria bacterium]|nr:hypothetical protein [Alphaproteobacteria bacterium]
MTTDQQQTGQQLHTNPFTGQPWPPQPIGLVQLAGMAFRGETLLPLAARLMGLLTDTTEDAAILTDLGTLHLLMGK